MSILFSKQNFLRFGSEALLIVFSLLLALILNEYRNSLNEKKLTEKYLDRLADELISNQKIIEEILPYHKDLLLNARKAYSSDSIRSELYKTGRLDIFKLAPKGIIKEIPSSVSWEITKQSGLSRNFDFELLYQISKTYKQQDFVLNETIRRLSDKVFDPEINLVENQDQTLYFFMMASNELYSQELELSRLISTTLEMIETIEN